MAQANRQKRTQSKTVAGAGSQQQSAIPAFVKTTIIPYLQTIQQSCLSEYARVTGLLFQIQFGFSSSVQPQMTANPSARSQIESLIGTPDAAAATPSLGGGTPSGPVDESTTIDAYILREMNNPKFVSGFTSQQMRQHLQDTWGANRTTPIKQNHVTNALRKHWEAHRLLAVGGNPLAKQAVNLWFPANIQNPPAGAYTVEMAQKALAEQQALAAE